MLVEEVITKKVVSINSDKSIYEAGKEYCKHKIGSLVVMDKNIIVGIITETDLTRTIYAFSEAVDELARFYNDSRENLEKMMDEWGNILVGLKGYKKLTVSKELDSLKET